MERLRSSIGFVPSWAGSTRVLRGACDALFTPRPLGPIYDVAAAAGRELNETLQGEAIPYQVAGVLIDDLRRHGPTVLVVDDVHWADEATLDVLRLVVRRIADECVLIVLSYRDEALDARHPVRVMLGEVATGLALTRIPLAPLSPEAVAQLAEPYDVDAGRAPLCHGRQPLLRDRGARLRKRLDSVDGARCRAGTGCAAERRGESRARCSRDRAASGGAVAARSDSW